MPGVTERDRQRDKKAPKSGRTVVRRGRPGGRRSPGPAGGLPPGTTKAWPLDDRTTSFGYWLKRRRKALDLTQEQLAQAVACSRFAIRKIEADERRPSRRLAERLADKLAIPPHEHGAFLETARSLRSVDQLVVDKAPLAPSRVEQPEASAFVGRGAESDLLVGLLAKLGAGSGHVVLVEGEPGIGKSRLIRELARHGHARGAAILATNCYEIESAMPYQPVIDLVTQALELAPGLVLQKLPPVSLAEIAALVPAVAQRAAVPMLSADFPEARQARLFGAIVQLFAALAAGRQLVAIVDDLQWTDDASAQFLHYLARQAASAPLLVLYAYRDEELDSRPRLADLVASLRREPYTRHLPLARLRLADTKELLAGHGGAELAARLQRETEGNAFFLTSMLHALREGEISGDAAGELPLPEALRGSVRARLAHVPAEARSTLDVAAVLGRRFDFESLFAVMKTPEDDLLRAVETLVRRRLLREESAGTYDFSHDKVREVAYFEIGGTRRRLLHRTVAETLEQQGEGEPHERDARLAEHYERGQVWGKAVHYMVLAAQRSQKLFAVREALQWFDRAIELASAHPGALTERALIDVHEQRGRARAQAGQTDGAVADIRIVIDAARGRADRPKARDALIQLGMTYRRGDDYASAVACLGQALDECHALGDERQAADTLYHLGTVMWSDGRNREATAYHAEAVAICERLGLSDLVAVQAYHGRGEAHFLNLEQADAIRCFRRSIELARSIGDKSYESENLMMVAYSHSGYMGFGDYAQARANFESALEIAQRADLQWHIPPTRLGLDCVRACLGEYASALHGIRQTIRSLERLKLPRYQVMAYELLTSLLLDLDLNQQAFEHAERGLALAGTAKITFWRVRSEASHAIARMRLGDLDVGPALNRTLSRARENNERTQMVRCLEGLAELALRRGDFDACGALGAEMLALAEAGAMSELAARGRLWSGEALAAAGERNAALEQLALAAATAEKIGRVRLAQDAAAALAKAGGDAAQRARAAALSARLRDEARDCQRLMATA
jgi:tetratricopeptide (TPR) repeat protein/transcriptional regulator with XRE-family HTH domain